MSEEKSNLIEQATIWVSSGRRCVDIKLENNEGKTPELTIWAYDYDRVYGRLLKDGDKFPTDDELNQDQISSLEGKLARLKNGN